VLAAASGTVTFAGMRGALGNYVEVLHADGLVTKYGHNSALFTQSGKRVRKGTPIAAMGMSGRATGPHLHFEIRDRHGVSHDPYVTNPSRLRCVPGLSSYVGSPYVRACASPCSFASSSGCPLVAIRAVRTRPCGESMMRMWSTGCPRSKRCAWCTAARMTRWKEATCAVRSAR
jgi:murein DD-endopeptidase MepM/ murein hydrolase activator NlpD